MRVWRTYEQSKAAEMKSLTRQPWIRLVWDALLGKYLGKLENINCNSTSLDPLWLHDEAGLKQAASLREERQ